MMFLCLWYASAFCTLWRIPLGPVSGPPPTTPFLQLYRLSVMIGFHWARRVPTFLSHGVGHSVLSLFSYFPSIPDPGSSLPSKVSLSSFHLQPQVNTSNKPPHNSLPVTIHTASLLKLSYFVFQIIRASELSIHPSWVEEYTEECTT